MTRPTDDEIVAEIDVLAHDAKLGTRHEQHDGWYFKLHNAPQVDEQPPYRVLTCGCGVVLVSAPVSGDTSRCRVVFHPADDQPDGMPAIPQVLGEYPHRAAAETVLDAARAQQTRRGTWRIEPV
ncbi:hypothetical protein J1770_gp57 [Gordonia phage EMoore]|uniref:Uncharacterized protein n=1 Tax=Gordonia phage EMoore TaxID=2656534 RepID=A0A649VW81_9CAUD|nr:hypothetical protein J1770_gp57 [Gordonia phage EMoore]QGJ95843.1 hypothetical protein SEA_EMOORE_57 [Gordonia phage EMoore]